MGLFSNWFIKMRTGLMLCPILNSALSKVLIQTKLPPRVIIFFSPHFTLSGWRKHGGGKNYPLWHDEKALFFSSFSHSKATHPIYKKKKKNENVQTWSFAKLHCRETKNQRRRPSWNAVFKRRPFWDWIKCESRLLRWGKQMRYIAQTSKWKTVTFQQPSLCIEGIE